MKKRYKIILVLIVLLIIIAVIVSALNAFTPKTEVKILETIEGFSYNLSDADTKLYKENYDLLKEELKKEEVDQEIYAKLIAKLFIIDLYTINNKINKYDVGGTEFVYTDIVDNYKLKVSDTIYKYISNEAKKDLPEVTSVTIESIEETEYELIINEEEILFDGYVIKANWDYEEDYGYDEEATIIIVSKEERMEIVEFTSGDLDEENN